MLQKLEHQRILPQRFDDVVDHRHHLVREEFKLCLLFHRFARIAQQLVAHPAQQRLHHRTLILKIQIKGALGHLGPAGDVLYAGFCGTSLQKQIIGCLQQCPALLLLFALHGTHSP